MKKYIIILFTYLIMSGCTSYVNATETLPMVELDSPKETPLTTQPDLSIPVSAGSHCRRYTDETTKRFLDYYLFVPKNAVKDMPLVIFLHGDGEVNNLDILENFGLIASAREIYGDEFPFIAISPCTREYSWINNKIPVTLKGLIDTIVTECEIDPNHIIITGHSRGAIGAWHMVNLYGDFFSAAVPVSSRYAAILNQDTMNNVPIPAMAGSREGCIREIQSLVDRINMSGGNVEFCIIDDCKHGQASSKAFTIETFTWM